MSAARATAPRRNAHNVASLRGTYGSVELDEQRVMLLKCLLVVAVREDQHVILLFDLHKRRALHGFEPGVARGTPNPLGTPMHVRPLPTPTLQAGTQPQAHPELRALSPNVVGHMWLKQKGLVRISFRGAAPTRHSSTLAGNPRAGSSPIAAPVDRSDFCPTHTRQGSGRT